MMKNNWLLKFANYYGVQWNNSTAINVVCAVVYIFSRSQRYWSIAIKEIV